MLNSLKDLPGCEGDTGFFLYVSIFVALSLGTVNFLSSIYAMYTYKSKVLRAMELFFEKKVENGAANFKGDIRSMQTISIAPFVASKIVSLSQTYDVDKISFERIVFTGTVA